MEVNEYQEKEMKMFITKNAEKNLRITAFWTKFNAILSFIGCAFYFLSGLVLLLMKSVFHSEMFSNFKFGLIFLIISLLMLIPAIFLYQYSIFIKRSLRNANVATLEVAFNKMKSYWLFIGIMSIVMILFSIIVSIFLPTAILTYLL